MLLQTHVIDTFHNNYNVVFQVSSVNLFELFRTQGETEDLSNVSFLSTDITRIVFHENARFGKLPPKQKQKKSNKVRFKKLSERFKIFDERRFEECIDSNTISELIKKLRKNGLHLVDVLAMYWKPNDKRDNNTISNLKRETLSLGSVLASYTNLRENYEYRLRYDEAGQFFCQRDGS